VDGDLGNGNTAEGLNALASLNGGFNNTAMGNGAPSKIGTEAPIRPLVALRSTSM